MALPTSRCEGEVKFLLVTLFKKHRTESLIPTKETELLGYWFPFKETRSPVFFN